MAASKNDTFPFFFSLTGKRTFNMSKLLVSCWTSLGAAGTKQWKGLLSHYSWGVCCTSPRLSSRVVKLRLATFTEFPKEDKTPQPPEITSQHTLCISSSPPCLQPNPVYCLPVPPLPLGNALQPEPRCEESSPQCGSSQPSRPYGSVCFISEIVLCVFALLWLARGERKQFFTGGKTATCEN